RPWRTRPGKPTDTLSKGGRLSESPHRDSTSAPGGQGWGVFTRRRSTIMAHVGSSTEALTPVPPMSTARVVGRGDPPGVTDPAALLSPPPGRAVPLGWPPGPAALLSPPPGRAVPLGRPRGPAVPLGWPLGDSPLPVGESSSETMTAI